MIRIGLKYLRYFLFSRHKRGHGIHSPFVYSFVREVLVNERGWQTPDVVLKWHKDLLRNQGKLYVGNLGAGSKRTDADFRKVSGIVRYSSIRQKYGMMLFRLVKYIQPESIIEMGTGLGVSTAYLAAAAPDTGILSIEASSDKSDFAKKQMKSLGFKNINFQCGLFDDLLDDLSVGEGKSVIFIDGNHNYLSTMKYFRHFRDQAGEESVLVFDDINWSEGMTRAWKEICRDDSVSISIDLFFVGIIFFKKASFRQHFLIKF